MPDPRFAVDYSDLGIETATAKIDGSTITYDATKPGGSAAVGLAVKFTSNDTLALVVDGDDVDGKLLQVFADGMATFQYGGLCTLPAGASASVGLRKKIVGAIGASSAKGYIREVVAAGSSYSQSEQAEHIKARHSIWNNADTAAVVVRLDS